MKKAKLKKMNQKKKPNHLSLVAQNQDHALAMIPMLNRSTHLMHHLQALRNITQ